uniref:Pentatricopeptide repeat-containing protein n=1 Tax=Ascaris lumbricoides TaxID=6252 RepID=A0A0M3HPS2_ASCLU
MATPAISHRKKPTLSTSICKLSTRRRLISSEDSLKRLNDRFRSRKSCIKCNKQYIFMSMTYQKFHVTLSIQITLNVLSCFYDRATRGNRDHYFVQFVNACLHTSESFAGRVYDHVRLLPHLL